MSSMALRFSGWVLLLGGVILLAAPGEIAVALGTSGPVPANGASDPVAMTFWRQLTFIRMFGTAALGLGAICLWCRRALTPPQHSSFIKVLVAVLVLMAWMALVQQTAIWGSNMGWVIVGALAAVAAACGSTLATAVRRQPV